MILARFAKSALLLLAAGALLVACQPTRNFTTYFNLFYNMERIMDEVEQELLYIREQKTPEPTYYIPYDESLLKGSRVFNHLDRLSMTQEEMRANKVKLDSILIKGSKLLARDAKSDYVDDAVYFIGKTFFYEREWFQSQKKAEELIANFPDSKWLPDAHLVLAMDMMHQGNIDGAEKMLSRTIDVAWAHKRLDVLIDAFRLNADVELARGNIDEALKPYRRAITLSSDDEDKARWQYEIGLIYFRTGDFPKALAELNEVGQYSPDVLTQFQTGLQREVTLRVLGQYDLAEEQLNALRHNGNFEAWYGMVELERLNLAATRPGGASLSDSAFAAIDTLYPNKGYSAYGIYERGVRAFRSGDLKTALVNFEKVQSMLVPFQRKAQRYAMLLNQYFDQQEKVTKLYQYPINPFPDSVKALISDSYYSLARLFTSLDIRDSISKYYLLSDQWAPAGSVQAARGLYARSVLARNAGKTLEADSLLDIIVQNYGMTEYAADARVRLGYTDYAKIDTAADLYNSGISYMKTGDNARALAQFERVIWTYPHSEYAPQAFYAAGLVFERALDDRDSAFIYYSRLLNQFPMSTQASAVRPIVDAVLASRMKKQGSVPNAMPNGGNLGEGEGNALNSEGGQTTQDQPSPEFDNSQNFDPKKLEEMRRSTGLKDVNSHATPPTTTSGPIIAPGPSSAPSTSTPATQPPAAGGTQPPVVKPEQPKPPAPDSTSTQPPAPKKPRRGRGG